MRVLVVAAHPDDEVLGCGATISRLAGGGHNVHMMILGEGVTSRYRTREEADPELVESLRAQSHKVAEILRAETVVLHNFPDNRFDTVPLIDITKVIEDAIVHLKPEVVYTHHGGDLNVDHEITHRAVLTATRPTKDHPVKEVYAFEIPSSTEWSFQHLAPVFRPNVFVDISGTLQIKLKALSVYESEMRDFPHPRSQEAIRASAERWGSVVGFEAAEAFELIRALRVGSN